MPTGDYYQKHAMYFSEDEWNNGNLTFFVPEDKMIQSNTYSNFTNKYSGRKGIMEKKEDNDGDKIHLVIDQRSNGMVVVKDAHTGREIDNVIDVSINYDPAGYGPEVLVRIRPRESMFIVKN